MRRLTCALPNPSWDRQNAGSPERLAADEVPCLHSHLLVLSTANRTAAVTLSDTAGDGAIDPEEFTVLCHELDPSMTDEQIAADIKRIDKDGDGLISFEEFRVWWEGDLSDHDSDDDDDEHPVNPLQQRLLALIMLKNRSQLSFDSGKWKALPDLHDPAVRKVGFMMLKVYNRRVLRKEAAAYRAEQLANLRSTPDWLAQQCGWADAAEMAESQYQSDVLDSKYGMGCGLEWGSERGPLAPAPGTMFSPVGRPARFDTKRGLAQHMVGHAWGTLARSDVCTTFHASVVAARFKKIVEHKQKRKAAEEERQLSHARAKEREAQKRQKAEESAVIYQRAMAERRARMCRGWQVALPKVMLCARLVVDCRQRMRRKQLERDLAEAVTEELAEIIALIRSSEHTTPQKTIELGGLGLSAEEWEAPPVVRSIEALGEAFSVGLEAQAAARKRQTSDGMSPVELAELFYQIDTNDDSMLDREEVKLLMDQISPGQSEQEFEETFDNMNTGGSGAVDLEEFQHWWKLEISSASPAKVRKMRQVQEKMASGVAADEAEGIGDIEALLDLVNPHRDDIGVGVPEAAVIVLAVGCNSDRHKSNASTDIMRPRMVAKMAVRHENAPHLANQIMMLMNKVSCGSGVWEGLLAVLAFMVEGFFSVLVDPNDAAFDRLYLPSEQKIVIDLLLRHPAHVDYSDRRSWVVWLRAVTGIVTTSREFRCDPRSFRERIRCLTLLLLTNPLLGLPEGKGVAGAIGDASSAARVALSC